MKIIGIIPARYASTRLPGKPLIDINGITMINRVYNQVSKCNKLTDIIIATDDERIYNHAKSFNANVAMTSESHQTGTDRCYEVASKINLNDDDIVVNIQGDEPFIEPEQIDLLIKCFENKDVEIATLVKYVSNKEDVFSNSVMKVIVDKNNKALYFSRTPIPYIRDIEKEKWCENFNYIKHIGIYGYKYKTLKEITLLPKSSLEKAESLEQLRWLENGYSISINYTTHDSFSIDTQEDVLKAEKYY